MVESDPNIEIQWRSTESRSQRLSKRRSTIKRLNKKGIRRVEDIFVWAPQGIVQARWEGENRGDLDGKERLRISTTTRRCQKTGGYEGI